MDVRQRILNEMAILSEVKQTNSVPYLQELLGYQPLMIHNAITQGLETATSLVLSVRMEPLSSPTKHASQ